jgi:hypothetical protein
MDETARFCSKCGAAVAASPDSSVATIPPNVSGSGRSKTRKKFLFAGLVILALVIAAIATPNLLHFGAASSQQNSPATTQPCLSRITAKVHFAGRKYDPSELKGLESMRTCGATRKRMNLFVCWREPNFSKASLAAY